MTPHVFASPNPDPPADRERCLRRDRTMSWIRVQPGYIWQCWTCGQIRFPATLSDC